MLENSSFNADNSAKCKLFDKDNFIYLFKYKKSKFKFVQIKYK